MTRTYRSCKRCVAGPFDAPARESIAYVRVAIECARRVLSLARHTLCRLNTGLKARGVANV